jgi:hypothetical protein
MLLGTPVRQSFTPSNHQISSLFCCTQNMRRFSHAHTPHLDWRWWRGCCFVWEFPLLFIFELTFVLFCIYIYLGGTGGWRGCFGIYLFKFYFIFCWCILWGLWRCRWRSEGKQTSRRGVCVCACFSYFGYLLLSEAERENRRWEKRTDWKLLQWKFLLPPLPLLVKFVGIPSAVAVALANGDLDGCCVRGTPRISAILVGMGTYLLAFLLSPCVWRFSLSAYRGRESTRGYLVIWWPHSCLSFFQFGSYSEAFPF